jgi:heme/copper-type cytochrome/quinol oxidase subunit 2
MRTMIKTLASKIPIAIFVIIVSTISSVNAVSAFDNDLAIKEDFTAEDSHSIHQQKQTFEFLSMAVPAITVLSIAFMILRKYKKLKKIKRMRSKIK